MNYVECFFQLQLWDTAGQERFRKSMIQHYYRNVHAVVFVYDVTNMSSFDSLPGWISECERYNLTRAVPRILIGNKLDCGVQIVPTHVAQKFADMHSMPVSIFFCHVPTAVRSCHENLFQEVCF